MQSAAAGDRDFGAVEIARRLRQADPVAGDARLLASRR